MLNPLVLGRLVAADGSIDNAWMSRGLWAAVMLMVAVAVASGLSAVGTVPADRWLGGLRRYGPRAAVWSVAAGTLWAVLWLTSSWWAWRVDLLAELRADHPLAARVRDLRGREGSGKARSVVALWSSRHVRPALPRDVGEWGETPVQIAGLRANVLSGIITEDAPGSTYRWHPGELVPWDSAPPSVRFQLERQTFLLPLVAGLAPADRRATRTALSFIQAWWIRNDSWPPRGGFAWNDDCMANRIMVELRVMNSARRLGLSTPALEGRHLKWLIRHARMLMDPNRHNFGSNHGMMQNCALLALAMHEAELADASRWADTAIARAERRIREHVTKRGVSLELAPGYDLFCLKQFLWFQSAARALGRELSPTYEHRLRRMLQALPGLLWPDHTMPAIGDTGREVVHADRWPGELLPPWPEAVHLRSLLASPDRPPAGPGVSFFPEAGYFFLRPDDRARSGKDQQVVGLFAGPASHAHGHPEKLTITLFGHGRPLLAGPGYPAYGARRQARIATCQHNTVSVDGGSQVRGPAEFVWTRFEPDRRRPSRAIVQARASLFAGVEHRRTLVFGPTPGAYLVIDRLQSSEQHAYAQHFASGPGLVARESEDGEVIAAATGGQALLRIRRWTVVGDRVGRPQLSRRGAVLDAVVKAPSVTIVALLETAAPSERAGASRLEVSARALRWAGSAGTYTCSLPAVRDCEWTPADVPSRTRDFHRSRQPGRASDASRRVHSSERVEHKPQF